MCHGKLQRSKYKWIQNVLAKFVSISAHYTKCGNSGCSFALTGSQAADDWTLEKNNQEHVYLLYFLQNHLYFSVLRSRYSARWTFIVPMQPFLCSSVSSSRVCICEILFTCRGPSSHQCLAWQPDNAGE